MPDYKTPIIREGDLEALSRLPFLRNTTADQPDDHGEELTFEKIQEAITVLGPLPQYFYMIRESIPDGKVLTIDRGNNESLWIMNPSTYARLPGDVASDLRPVTEDDLRRWAKRDIDKWITEDVKRLECPIGE